MPGLSAKLARRRAFAKIAPKWLLRVANARPFADRANLETGGRAVKGANIAHNFHERTADRMPNIAALLKDEISRLSRKEIRRQMGPMRKASAAHRRHIAALKREIARLEKTVASLGKRASAPAAAAGESDDGGAAPRFQARGLVSLRSRLGLSAAELAKLIGVSSQSVYNWEHRKATPRRSQIAQIAQLRGLGKKEARARLDGTPAAAPKQQRAKKAVAKKRARRKA